MSATMQVPEVRRVADPPLMRVENEAGHAYLSLLLHLSQVGGAALQEAAGVRQRLLDLCVVTLDTFRVRPGHHLLILSWRSSLHGPRHLAEV